MPFQISPGVNVTEKDLTNIVPAVATTIGGIAGYFNWGPAEDRVLVDSENNLVSLFGKPDNNTAEQWWTAANFLGYNNALQVVRKVNTDAANAGAYAQGYRGTIGDQWPGAGLLVKNPEAYDALIRGNTGSEGAGLSGGDEVFFIAKYAGELGNSLKVSMSDKHESVFGNGGAAASVAGGVPIIRSIKELSLIHISEPTRPERIGC